MANKPLKPCSKPGCPNLAKDQYCTDHISLASKTRTKDRDKARQYDKQRGNANTRGYDAKWRAYRTDYLKRNPKCITCGATATVVDHILPHKGNKGLFWTRFNHQPLCTTCHNRKTATQDMGAW